MTELDALNAATPEDFAAALAGVFEHAPWVAAAAAAHRPFATVEALHAALMRAVREAPERAVLALLNNHPELAAEKLAAGLTAESRAEQTGLAMAGTAGAEALPERNRLYRERFGFPFIVCVRRHTAANVLRTLEARLGAAPDSERDTALREVGHITLLRLAERVRGPGRPELAGHLGTHVLDTAAGRPAAGLRLELLQEGRRVAEAETDADGRVAQGLLPEGPLRMGQYEFRFAAGAYFAARGLTSFYDVIPVRFAVAEAEGRYHVPLLLSPFGYTTYRGS